MLPSTFAALFAASPDAILIADEKGHYVDANLAALALLGYTREQLLSLSIGDVVAPGPIWAAEEYARFLREGQWQGEVELRTRDGRLVPAEARAIVVPGPDGPLYASFLRDITDHKRREADNTRLAVLVQSSADAIMSLSLEGRIISWNPAAERLYGYSAEEAIGQPVNMLAPPERAEAINDFLARLHTGESITGVETVRLTKDRRRIDVALTSAPIRDATGVVVASAGIVRDITDRKRMEEMLRQSEERFRTAFEHAPIGMDLVTLDGHFLQVNAALCALLGYTEAELLARTFHDITHPDDRAADLEQAEQLLSGTIPSFQVEKRYLRKDGTTVWVCLNASLVRDEHGEPLHFIGQIEDITTRKAVEAALREAETKYRTLVEQLPAVVYLVANDAHYRPLFYNSYIETLTGQTPEEAVARTDDWLECIHPEDREQTSAEGERALALGEAFRAEYRYYRMDGSYTWVRDECVPLRDDAGQISAWQGVMFDISERKQAEEALHEAMDAAQAANRAKEVFLDLMSHELRTPLQAVLGYSEFLLIAPKDSLTDAQREDIGYIHQAGGRMLALINQLLDLSRMDAGSINLASKPFDLGQVIESVRQDIAPQAAAKRLAVEITLAPSLPPITGDAERVRQILLNLAGNAVKFTQQGSIRITASSTASGGVEVAVSDTGIGITAEALVHIFEAFHQVESGVTRHHQGSGLGLAIAWRLAQQMGGSLSVRSEPGVGSTFTLHLPGGAYHA
jgi:PAS domain S-box-containing protein